MSIKDFTDDELQAELKRRQGDESLNTFRKRHETLTGDKKSEAYDRLYEFVMKDLIDLANGERVKDLEYYTYAEVYKTVLGEGYEDITNTITENNPHCC